MCTMLLGKNMPQWFVFIFKVCLIPSTSCRPFFTKESDYQVWLKWIFLYMGSCFSQLWIWQAHVFPSISVILEVVKTQSSQDFLFTIVQYKLYTVKETNEVFDNQFLSEMSWAESVCSIIISCSVAVHIGFFHLKVLILSLQKMKLHLRA